MGAEMKSDLDRIGLFKEMSYLHGVEYTPGEVVFNEASHRGKQMLTSCTKTKSAKLEGYFDKEFARIFEGEGYNDPIRLRRLFRLEQAKKNRPDVFKPSSPVKKPCGLGSNYGTFDAYNKERIPAFSAARVPKVKIPCPGKNFLVKPPAKGTGYGYPNVTLTKFPPYFLEGEYEKLKDKEPEAKKTVEGEEKKTVFVLGTREEQYFDRNPFYTERPGPIYKPLVKPEPIEVPFIPPSPLKRDGGMKAGCFDKFPEYMSCPYTGVAPVGRCDKNVVNSSGKTFKPWHGPRIYPIRSIVTANVQKEINGKNYDTVKGILYCER